MPKPIFLIGFPRTTQVEQIQIINKALDKKLKDYHTLTYLQNESDEMLFNVFYDKDMDNVKFEEIKEFVNNKMKGDDNRD